MPSNVLPLHLKQTFPPIIRIFTEGDGIEPRLPFKIFSTLMRNFFPRAYIPYVEGTFNLQVIQFCIAKISQINVMFEF